MERLIVTLPISAAVADVAGAPAEFIERIVRSLGVPLTGQHSRAAEAVDNEAALRQIIADCAAALPNGAGIAPSASIDFMRNLPDEIRLVCARLSASPASPSPATGVRVKALEWEMIPSSPSGEWHAISPVGLYCIPLGGVGRGKYSLHLRDGEGVDWFDTIEDAKAAAQSDYQTRVLSALVEQP